jgi:hypothetical protein
MLRPCPLSYVRWLYLGWDERQLGRGVTVLPAIDRRVNNRPDPIV